jgi:hypothetical protein
MVTVLWYVMLCHWVCSLQCFEGTSSLQNLRNCSPSDTVIPGVVTVQQHHCENLRYCTVIIMFNPLLYLVLAYINIVSSPQHMEHEGGGGCGRVDPCIFPSLHIITYCDKELSEAHKEVFVMYGWHLEQRCPGGDKRPWALLWVGCVLHV